MSPLPDPKTELQIQAALEYLEQVLPQSACLKIVQLIDKLPEPVSALQRLEKFYSQLPWELGSKDTDGKFIYAALTVFANSRYLSNVIMNSPELLHWALGIKKTSRCRFSTMTCAGILVRFQRSTATRMSPIELQYSSTSTCCL